MARGFASLPPAHRTLMAQIGNMTRWARATTPAARAAGTAPARRALHDGWARQVDPDGVLPAAELARAVERLRRAHMARMTLASARARSSRGGGRRTPAAEEGAPSGG